MTEWVPKAGDAVGYRMEVVRVDPAISDHHSAVVHFDDGSYTYASRLRPWPSDDDPAELDALRAKLAAAEEVLVESINMGAEYKERLAAAEVVIEAARTWASEHYTLAEVLAAYDALAPKEKQP